MNADLLRPYALILGYQYKVRCVHFLIYHNDGVTGSQNLDPFTDEGLKSIIHLFLALLTNESLADVGLLPWYNGVEICLPEPQGQPADFFVADIGNVLHNNTCVRGRSLRAFRVKKRTSVPSPSLDEGGNLESITETILRRSI